MARRRDSVSRNTTRNDQFASRINGERYQTRLRTTSLIEAERRARGRRGVRARARNARIEARINAGTYRAPDSVTTNIYPTGMRQPGGGSPSNS